ncbi:MAG: hypothetical protein KJO82_08420, partial [Gammaproteobacteria bacterium]|nr:hypothetical protein [Gammaproteobacteria bacterium]
VPFIAGQMRIAIYPQLEPQWGSARSGGMLMRADHGFPASAPMKEAAIATRSIAEAEEMDDKPARLDQIVVTGSRISATNFARYAPNAIVQVGSGIPSWQWNGYSLNWSGPVDAEQTMRLVILPRWVVSLLRVIETGLLILFAAVLAAGAMQKRFKLPGGLSVGRSATASLLLAIIAFGTLATTPAQAEIPDSEILKELERRLLSAPDCMPQCADVVDADVDVGDGSIRIRLTINAQEDVAVPLPGSSRGWRPEAVVVGGTSSAEVFRSRDQNFWLRVPEGRHTVTLSGRVDAVDNIEIAFPAPPRVLKAEADGWFIAGIKDRRLLSGSLHLTRLHSSETGDGRPRWESSRFPPFVQVTRNIELGLDWRVTTTVQRIAPVQGAMTLELPLIEGESVLSENMTVRDGKILVSMNPTQGRVTWQSNLPRTSPLNLASEASAPWKEVWLVNVGSVWHAEFSGVPESESGGRHADVRTAEFYPRGGESLQVVATRPEAAQGTTLAFDSVGVRIEQGARSRTTTMNLSYRSTRGAQHVIRLPAEADVTRVTIDGSNEPLRADEGELTLPILPGEHAINVEWREDVAATRMARTPDIDLGAAASNITLELNLPANRWLLGTNGPALGPAVLYWSELAVLILLAFALGRLDWTPLSSWQWLLLGIGFSTFSWPVLGFVAAWIVIVGARDRFRTETGWLLFNLQQLGLTVMTVIALVAIVTSLPGGLLGTPDMHVAGNNSWGNHLVWFADRSDAALPGALAISAPMWIYKALILAWALWLSFALLKWLPWTWQCFAREGFFRSRSQGQNAVEASGD